MRKNLKTIKQKRDGAGGAILLVPLCVLQSQAYMTLSGEAVRLLFDISMQYNTHNNGALLASWRHMNEKRGWTSADTLNNAKKELVEHRLICLTVQGCLPNKASWYGLTWNALDDIKGFEIATQSWPRGAYARWIAPVTVKKKRTPPLKKITSSCP
jgi:hypothetical protein